MNIPIVVNDNHRDLGVNMSLDGSFKDHIENIIKKIRKKIGWICRSFISRDIQVMRKLYISTVMGSRERSAFG